MALDSVNYDEDRAIQILQIVNDEEEKRAKSSMSSHGINSTTEHSSDRADAVDNISGRIERYIQYNDASYKMMLIIIENLMLLNMFIP